MRQPSNPRQTAYEVLVAVERGAFADAELGRRLRRAELEPRDQGLATRLVYGTLAWQGYLDHVIAGASRRAAIDVPVRIILRLALLQLLKLTRVPDHAAVDTAVELTKRLHPSGSGFVNAVLRRVVRERDAAVAPPDEPAGAAALALRWSHPEWLVRVWLGELGTDETVALLAANNEPAPTVLRVNRQRAGRGAILDALASAGIGARAGHYAPDAIVLEEGIDPQRVPGFADGRVSMQGEASQLVALMIGTSNGDVVWDACAAPGGKAAYLAEQLGTAGRVVATDVNQRGIDTTRDAARRLGLSNVVAAVTDAAADVDSNTVPSVVDAALVDAPCSGLGTLRQHPEIRWRRMRSDLDAAARRQGALLAAVARRIRPGGTLVYATCTMTRIENDDVVAAFRVRHPSFVIDDPRPLLPAPAHALIDAQLALRTLPHRHGLDGFFAVRLKRQD